MIFGLFGKKESQESIEAVQEEPTIFIVTTPFHGEIQVRADDWEIHDGDLWFEVDGWYPEVFARGQWVRVREKVKL